MRAACDKCAFFDVTVIDNIGKKGLCRRRPPNDDGEFPPVFGDDWCGEFQPDFRDEDEL